MKTVLTLIVLCSSLSALATIYGMDDRRDINQVTQYRTIAKSVAIAVAKNFLEENRDGTWVRKDAEALAGSSEVYGCPNIRFAAQPIVGNCTGFLVGKRHLVTAGHCILPNGVINDDRDSPYCKAFSWVLDFNVNAQGKTFEKNIPSKNLYSCTRIIRAENTETRVGGVTLFGNDFAVLELDRDVPAEFAPLAINPMVPGLREKVFTIGHPSGLPAKFSGHAPVIANQNNFYFEANMDTQGGNSGGPVFDAKNAVRGILVSGHPVDYVMETRGCYKPNVCNDQGLSCLEDSAFPGQQTSNYVQRIDAILPYL